MDEDEECTSRFFQTDTSFPPISPLRIPAADSSLDSSQNLSQTSDTDDLSLSQLTIEEQIPLNIQTLYNITPRKMPVSPHYVIEEEFANNPWAMLIATIFLTKTTSKVARPQIKAFLEEYPTPYDVLDVDPCCLEKYFECLGLRKRAYMIWRLTYQFVSAKWRRASDLCGVGKYGEDAYRIFCLGHTDVEPNDRYLRLYLDWLRSNTSFAEETGVVDSECFIMDPVRSYYRITLPT